MSRRDLVFRRSGETEAKDAFGFFLDTQVDPGRKLNDFERQTVEAVGIENIRFRADSGNYG